jgi:short-subunit dehydrogenase
MWCTHAALPALKQSRGLLVGMSSLAGRTGVPARTAYCASKFAMSGFFEALRIELAQSGVDVTMIFPGVVATAIRRNGLDGSGHRAGKSGLDESGAMSVERCATLAIAGMRARRREVVMTRQGRLGLKLKAFAPQVIDRLALKALAEESNAR